jgi:hypothetical protein
MIRTPGGLDLSQIGKFHGLVKEIKAIVGIIFFNTPK